MWELVEIDGMVDGVLNVQFAQTLAKGEGRIHGVDASEAMITAAKKAAASDGAAEKVCTFEGKLNRVSESKEFTDDWG
jgi:tRNA/tmRNA/rRNA uracil-C5-methylase (TrmA/RlmC/RlmD family)